MLAVPVNEFDGRDEDAVSSEPCTEKPDNETKTEKQEQKAPANDNPSSSTQDISGETLVPVDAPADVKTRLISVNIKKGQGRSYTIYGKGRYGQGKALWEDWRRQCNRPRKRSDKKLHQAAVGAYRC